VHEAVAHGQGASAADKPQAAVERILRIPNRYRRFTVERPELPRRFGIGDALLAQLLDLGVPHADDRFDRLDLENIGLALRLPCPRNTAMRWWARALSESRVDRSADTLLLRAWCPAPGHPGECGLTIAPELSGAVVAQGESEPAGVWFKLSASRSELAWVFGPPLTGLFERARSLEFHLLPPALNADLGFLASTGLADCQLATAFLVSKAADLGLPVRAASGIFIARPYPTEHHWIECRVDDGRWLAADPFLLNALRMWGIIDGPEWTIDWSPHSLLWRTGTPITRLVTHGGHRAPYLLTVA
jgi:hypothetical protein